MRIARLVLPAAVACAALPACSDDDARPDRSDAGADAGIDAGTDAGASTAFTLHYHRAAPVGADSYDGWTVTLSGDVDESSALVATVDAFGAVFELTLPAGASTFTYQFTDGESVDPASPVTVDPSAASGEAWHWEGGSEARLTAPPAVPTAEQVVFYYLRPDGNYVADETEEEYGIYTWGQDAPQFSWPDRVMMDGTDPDLGAHYVVDLIGESPENCPFGNLCFIVQAGSDGTKDPDADRGVDTTATGNQFFLASGIEAIYTCPQREPSCILGAGEVAIQGGSAHFLRQGVIAAMFDGISPDRVELRFSGTAEIEVGDVALVGGETVELTADGELSGDLVEQFPQLDGFTSYAIAEADQAKVPDILRGQMVVGAYDGSDVLLAATKVQPAGVLDELYAYDGPLGLDFGADPVVTRVWAPTAQNVRLEVFDENLDPVTTADMVRSEQGVWSADVESGWLDGYYRYEVTVYHPVTGAIETFSVTDPYSTSLSADSEHTQIVDVLNDPRTKPDGWDALQLPDLAAPEDLSIYELHIRDFSIDDPTVPEADRGKYRAFTYNGVGGADLSNGMAHLSDLADSGLSLLHLLPTFDIATVEEQRDNRVEITDGFDRLCDFNQDVPEAMCTQYGTQTIESVLESFDGTSDEAQEVLGYMRDLDGFNWGYDPFHYNVPEGSYASEPTGIARVRELREAVMALADVGLRTALDVVYNHTNASGPSAKSVLDKVVPWYYHRLDPTTGLVANETCCQDTATEHDMMEKLMIDSVISWAKAYKMSAFRFDLMGYHLKRNMEALQAEVEALRPPTDGIDGREIYIYGEGWNPGSQGAARGTPDSPNATQLTLDGTGIGTFSDRLRDAVRGGGPFDSGMQHVQNQGFINGMAYDPNDPQAFDEGASARVPGNDLDSVRLQGDQIRVGLAGNLQDFRLVSASGNVVTGAAIDYNGLDAGYTLDPQEVVTYVEKHDNETLFDISNYKVPLGTDMTTRVRIQNLGIDFTALAQGVPFFHAGMDLLRSKSMDRNSFNSGDWFNRIDWTGQRINFRIGLPPAGDNMASYDEIGVVFDDAAIAPSQPDADAVSAHLREMLAIRESTPLFRLRTGDEVKQRVDFHNTGPDQVPGLVVMSLTDGTDCPTAVPDLDPAHDAVLVMFNANDAAQTFELAGTTGFELHPEQADSVDPVVRTAAFDAGTFSVPGRTTAVFIQPQSGAQGTGLPCNVR